VAIWIWLCVTAAAFAANSALPMVLVKPAPFGSTELEFPELGWQTPASITVLPFRIWQLPPMQVKNFLSVISILSPTLERWEMGTTSPKVGLREHLVVFFCLFLETGRCLGVPSIANVMVKLVKLSRCQFASGMSARFCSHVGLISQVKPCSCVPDCYNIEIPRGLG